MSEFLSVTSVTQPVRRVSSSLEPDPRALTANIPPNVLVHLTELAAQRGIASEAWFAGLGITRQQINDPSVRISYRQARSVLARGLKAMGDPALGLQIGRSQTVGSFGLLGLAMMTSRNFGEAMTVGIANHKVSGSLLDADFAVINDETVALQAWPRFGEVELLPFLCEEMFASSFALARELVGPRLDLVRVELTYSAPGYAREYSEAFQCDVRFGAQYNRILVDTHWLDHPLPGYNPLTSRQALALCQAQLAGIKRQSEVVASVERILRGRLRDHPTLDQVARTLNLSGRTLRRQLAAAGHAYRDIHDHVRAKRALELLRAGALSIADIGVEIGFSDAREFRRAFKRWTGAPPRAMRTAN